MAHPTPKNETKKIAIEIGRKIFSRQCDFLRGVMSIYDFPDSNLPEIAFAGRSNVGKSSLLNALTNRKTLSRTSNMPGRTREINFFNLADHLMLVDLPGYGYARISKRISQKWTSLVNDYLKGRSQLRRVILLIDSRHGIKDSDLKVMKMLDITGVSYQAVLTKSDKISDFNQRKIAAKVSEVFQGHTAAHPETLVTSIRTGSGIPELRATLAALVESVNLQ